MEKVKPYWFWIICGLVLIAEVIAMLIITPSHDLAPGQTVEEVVARTDARFRVLQKEGAKAQRVLQFNDKLVPDHPPISPEDEAAVTGFLER